MKRTKFLFFVIPTIILLSIFSLLFLKRFDTDAGTSDTFTTSVTVGNSAPVITVAPAESTPSYAAAPTSPGTGITFNITATDDNYDGYYLIVCKTNAVNAGASGAAPTCASAPNTYCVSSSTTQNTQASCTHTTSSSNPWENIWYAFVCDNNTAGSTCSTSQQGSGNSGSAFYVNHPPIFTSTAGTLSANPGSSVTWTTVANDTQDGNNIQLLVCKTQAMSGGSCTGGAWCTSTAVLTNPTCSYSIPDPTPDGTVNAYVYVIDQFNVPAEGTNPQTTNKAYTVNNVAPVVSAVTINSGSAITLEEAATKSITVTATVTDKNSCNNPELTNGINAYVYRSGITYATCLAGPTNANNCYSGISCSVVAGSCTGIGDSAANYTCTINMEYYADPTDSDNIATSFSAQNWLASVKATDDDAASHYATSGGVEVNSLITVDCVEAGINYGNISAGSNSGTLNKTVQNRATGNVPLDLTHCGTSMCTDYPTCSATGKTPIASTQQEFHTSSGISYGSGTDLPACASPVAVNINIDKVTTSTPTSKLTYWGVAIPLGTIPGTYSGLNTVTAVKNIAL